MSDFQRVIDRVHSSVEEINVIESRLAKVTERVGTTSSDHPLATPDIPAPPPEAPYIDQLTYKAAILDVSITRLREVLSNFERRVSGGDEKGSQLRATTR